VLNGRTDGPPASTRGYTREPPVGEWIPPPPPPQTPSTVQLRYIVACHHGGTTCLAITEHTHTLITTYVYWEYKAVWWTRALCIVCSRSCSWWVHQEQRLYAASCTTLCVMGVQAIAPRSPHGRLHTSSGVSLCTLGGHPGARLGLYQYSSVGLLYDLHIATF